MYTHLPMPYHVQQPWYEAAMPMQFTPQKSTYLLAQIHTNKTRTDSIHERCLFSCRRGGSVQVRLKHTHTHIHTHIHTYTYTYSSEYTQAHTRAEVRNAVSSCGLRQNTHTQTHTHTHTQTHTYAFKHARVQNRETLFLLTG